MRPADVRFKDMRMLVSPTPKGLTTTIPAIIYIYIYIHIYTYTYIYVYIYI
jgi:hypothetical protein